MSSTLPITAVMDIKTIKLYGKTCRIQPFYLLTTNPIIPSCQNCHDVSHITPHCRHRDDTILSKFQRWKKTEAGKNANKKEENLKLKQSKQNYVRNCKVCLFNHIKVDEQHVSLDVFIVINFIIPNNINVRY